MLENRSVIDWPTGVTVYKPSKCYNGYTIINPYRSVLILLIDMHGRVVKTWYAHPDERRESWFTKLLPNGNWLSLLYRTPVLHDASSPLRHPDSFSKKDFHSSIVEMSWGDGVIWEYQAASGGLIHHDASRLRSGNTLILLEKEVTVAGISEKPVAENFLIEVTPENEIAWEWYTTEHYDEFAFSEKAKELMREEGGDIFHTNTLHVLPGNRLGESDPRFRKGNILCCQRNTNTIFIIDRITKEIVWTWGEKQVVGPHHPTMLKNGNILIYDNGGQAGYPPRTRFYTRLVEINPLTGRIIWEYAHERYSYKETAKFFSPSWGSVQRLPNGNTFSLDAHKGRLFEITPQGEIVWEYISPFAWGWGTRALDSGMYRAYRYGYDEISGIDPVFEETSGHIGAPPCCVKLPPEIGLPSLDLP